MKVNKLILLSIRALALSTSLLITSTCLSQARTAELIDPNSKVSFAELVWQLSGDAIQTFDTDSNYFYRTIVIHGNEGEAELEGEVMDHLYVLKGEYGEYPGGKLFDLGAFYNIKSIDILTEQSRTYVLVRYGPLRKEDEVKILIE